MIAQTAGFPYKSTAMIARTSLVSFRIFSTCDPHIFHVFESISTSIGLAPHATTAFAVAKCKVWNYNSISAYTMRS